MSSQKHSVDYYKALVYELRAYMVQEYRIFASDELVSDVAQTKVTEIFRLVYEVDGNQCFLVAEDAMKNRIVLNDKHLTAARTINAYSPPSTE
jgi:hypothetical protein